MSVQGFIARRFDAARTMPRSVRLMRAVAGAGIAVAAAALIIALSIGRGFERAYTKALLDFNAHLVVMGPGELPEAAPVVAALEAFRHRSPEEAQLLARWGWAGAPLARLADAAPWLLPERARRLAAELEDAEGRGVVATTPFLYREALAIGGGAIRGAVVKGVDPATVQGVNGMRLVPFEKGATLEELLAPTPAGRAVPVIVGAALAEAMGVRDRPTLLRLLIPRSDAARRDGRDFREVMVVGTFESGIHDYDAEFLLMRMQELRRLFDIPGEEVSGVEVKLDDALRAGTVAQAIVQKLGPKLRAITWQELNGDLIAAVRLERLVSAVIMGLMLVVASLNIVAALTMTTLHRMREMAILKAIGLPERRVVRLLVRAGMSVGLRGVIVGLAVGLAVAWAAGRFDLVPLDPEIYLIRALPIDISGVLCGFLALFCSGVLFATSRFAARRLGGIAPAEGLAQAR